MRTKRRQWLWMIFVVMMIWAPGAFADDYYVDASAGTGGDGSVGSPYKTIQQGLNAADTGDTVWVHQGTYHQDIVMKNGVELRNITNEWPVIQGSGTQVVIQASGMDSSTTLRGFTVRGGHSDTAGAVDLRESSMVVIGCRFEANSGGTGGAILISGDTADPTLSDCNFLHNSASAIGGAVAVTNGADPVFTNCRFLFNQAGAGGAVCLKQSSADASSLAVSFDQCTFESNHAYEGGGVFNCYNSGAGSYIDSTFTRCRFYTNTATTNGGAFWANGMSGVRTTVLNSLFRQNAAEGNGNAMYCNTTNARILNSVFYDNTADDGGTGIAVYNTIGYFSLSNSILYHNGDQEIGGSNHDEITVSHNLIEGGWGTDISNIDADPMFVGASYDNFTLKAGSPCIDAGLNLTILPDEDIDGHERIIDGDGDGLPVVDMGISELVRPSEVYVDDDWAGTAYGTPVGEHTYGVDAFSNIQSGIDAVAGPGRVVVYSGSYFEHLALKTNVVVEGREVPASSYVVLVGNGSPQHLVTIDGCTTGTTGLSGLHLVLGNDAYAGIMVMDSNVEISDCDISGNGVGIHMANSIGTIEQCRVSDNLVGIRNEASDPLIRDCTIIGNRIRGMENMDASPTIERTTFQDHDGALADSGAAIRNVNSSPLINTCIFDNNRIGSASSPAGQGGAIYNDNAFPMILNSEFTGNLARYGGAVFSTNYAKPQFSHCLFDSNQAERGGVTYAIGLSPVFSACDFLDNMAETGGGSYSSDAGANPRFENCVFAGNQTTGNGGGIYAGNYSAPQLINCVIWGNAAGTDGSGRGGGIYETYTQPVVINSIIRDNSPTQIYDSSGETTATYSNIQGGYPGTGNIDTDPLFADADAYDFQLETSSPCIDSGVTAGGAVMDTAMAARPRGSSTDMGVYEYAGSAVLQARPDPADFGEVVLGANKGLKVSITNTGILDLVITDIALESKARFSIVPKMLPITVATGAETVVMLTFEPGTALGTSTNELRISSNNLTGQVIVPMVGVGIQAPHTITAGATAGGGIDPQGTVTVADGADQVFTMMAATGYSLSDVLVDGVSVGTVDTYTFSSVTTDHTIQAVFAPITHTITATAGAGGGISPSGEVTVNDGGDAAFSITPASGYVIDDVLVDGVSVGTVASYTFTHVAADHTIAVTFDTLRYTLSASAGVGGTISPSGIVQVAALADQTFTIIPLSWMEIGDVLVDGASVGAVSSYTFTSVAANHTIEAFFEDSVPDVWVDDDYAEGEPNDGHTWGTDAFASVQAGIDAVTTPAVVHVAAGNYNERLTLKSGVQVIGAGPEVTLLDGHTGSFGIAINVEDVDDTAVFDGFTVFNGQGMPTQGGGMNIINSNLVIRNCIFETNTIGLQNDNSSPQFFDCIFRNNAADGMRNQNNSNPILTDCRFEQNGTRGMTNVASSPELLCCEFIGNYTTPVGASQQGGAMYNSDSTARLTDCRFEDNVMDDGTGVLSSGTGGAIYNFNASPELLRCDFIANGAVAGGAMTNMNSSPVITDCRFTNNMGAINSDGYGGAMANYGSAPTITNCVFTGNSNYRGGALYFQLSGGTGTLATITNSIFSNNTALMDGGGIWAGYDGIVLNIVNSVLEDNLADSDNDGSGDGGGLFTVGGAIEMVNTIVWDNNGSEIFNYHGHLPAIVQYSNIMGGYGVVADANIDDDPLFVDASAGNFRLQAGSPCIDTGTSTGAVSLPDTDISGTTRPLGLSHDMGAYEYATGQDIAVSPSSLAFDDTAVGATASLDLVVSNAGDQDLSVTAMALSDATHFAIIVPALPATILPGNTLTLTVDFTPAGAGLHNADLTISSNDPDEALTVIGLSGTGLAVNHTITAGAGTGGQISPSGAVTVSQGSDQAFTITAGSGYNLANVLVDGASVGTVGSYTFTSVTADHTIEALFEPQTGFAVGAVSGATGEDGTSATFTVVLTREPSADVVIPVASNDALEVSVSTDNLVFTPANWDTPQTVTISGLDDDVDDGDRTVTILLFPAESSDPDYYTKDPSDPTVINMDDDTAGIVIGDVSGSTNETGTTATFTVVLASEPTDDVEITIDSDDPTEGGVSTDSLMFTPETWDTPQAVTITGLDDTDNDGDVTYAIILFSFSSDPLYDDADLPDVMVTNVDDDTQTEPADDSGGGGGGGSGCFIRLMVEQ